MSLFWSRLLQRTTVMCWLLVGRIWGSLGGGSGGLAAQTQPPLDAWHVLPDESSEMTLKLFTHERVEDRADATVEVRQITRQVEGVVQAVLHCARGIDLNGLEKNDDIVGSPAGEESEYNDKYQLDRAAFLFHAGGQDANRDASVTVHEHEKWKQEKDQKLLIVGHETPDFYDFLGVTIVLANEPLIRIIRHVAHDDFFQAGQDAYQPNGDRGDDGVQFLATFCRSDRMHDGEVAVEGHERQKQDRTVVADEVGAADRLAHEFAKNPLRVMIYGLKRQRGGEEQVGDDQVQEENIGHCLEVLELVEDEKHQSISEVTQNEDAEVEVWDDFGSKFVECIFGAVIN